MRIHGFTHREHGHLNLVITDRDQIPVMQPSCLRNGERLPTAHRRQRQILDPILGTCIGGLVDMASEHGTDVATGNQNVMDLVPVVTVRAFPPAGMVEEHKLMPH